MKADNYLRLRTAMMNSKHLRGSGSILDLAFDQIEFQDSYVRELYMQIAALNEELGEHERTLCCRIKQWFKRAKS